jgi:hypothetical protein
MFFKTIWFSNMCLKFLSNRVVIHFQTFVIKFSENLQSIQKIGQSDKTLFMNTYDHLNKSNLLLENSYKITLISSIV